MQPEAALEEAMAGCLDNFGPSDGDQSAVDLSFASLKTLGISLAQQLSADSWTDFNTHDPGVTLLEQFCYAITDLVYRTEFESADYLTGPDGSLDLEKLGLRRPEQIFSCRPSTVADYRRILLDGVSGLEDIWISPVATEDGHPAGLYRFLLRPSPEVPECDRARIVEAVDARYNNLRNLGEDALEISFVSEIPCQIHAEVEVQRGRAPAEIAAEIYQRCAEHLGMADRGAERAIGAGSDDASPAGGWPGDAGRQSGPVSVAVSDFFTLIRGIEGVDFVDQLFFRIGDQVERNTLSTTSADQAIRLHLPGQPDEVRIRLFSRGRRLEIPFDALRDSLDGTRPDQPARVEAERQKPTFGGEYRDLGEYTSVQNQLPANYPVGRHGLPVTASRQEQARSHQLKTYLLLFDQFMANFTAQIAGLRGLFTPEIGDCRGYTSQLLDCDQIVGLDRIYPPEAEESLNTVFADYDRFGDRKGRLLDYLLALYGESFSQNSLRTFNIYASEAEQERALLDNKIRFIRSIVELGRDRGAAFDYRKRAGQTISGLHHRVSYLLGFTDHRRHSLTAVLTSAGLLRAAGSAHGLSADSACLYAESALRPLERVWESVVPLTSAGAGESLVDLMDTVGHLLSPVAKSFGISVLKTGIELAEYRLEHLPDDESWRVFLSAGSDGGWYLLGNFSGRDDAIGAVNRLRRLIVLLNSESEGMHVVEHILLRPRSHREQLAEPSFFGLRVSILFPAWTARCAKPGFRQLAAETVQRNCPAHIVADIHWLEFDDMRQFEARHSDWLQQLADRDTQSGGLDEASGRLLEFLRARRPQPTWRIDSAGDVGEH